MSVLNKGIKKRPRVKAQINLQQNYIFASRNGRINELG
jgi:hypothetical protein